MSFKRINISDLCNHKLIYENAPSEEEMVGLDNIYVLSKDFDINKKLISDNFEIEYCSGLYDNVVCDLQKINVNSFVKRIHFIGFAYWGDTCENIKIIFDDGSENWVELKFIDWSQEYKKMTESHNPENEYKIKDVHVMISSGKMIHLIYFHDSICEIDENKMVKEIVLPDNLLIHIFAITVEY